MNNKFIDLIQEILAFFKKNKILENSKRTETQNEVVEKVSRRNTPSMILGMDSVPFVYPKNNTAPEREMDFLIEHEKVEDIISYLKEGYILNKNQIFDLFQGYQMGIRISHRPPLKELFLKDYLVEINSIIQDAIVWSDKKETPILELMPLAYKEAGAEEFMKQKTKGYVFLKHVFEYLPEAYNCTLDEFHRHNLILKKTIESIPERNSGSEGLIPNSLGVRMRSEVKEIMDYHVKSYSVVAKKNIDNLKTFISNADILKNQEIQPQPQPQLQSQGQEKEQLLVIDISMNKFKKLPPKAQEIIVNITMLLKDKMITDNESKTEDLILNVEQKLFLKNVAKTDLPQIVDQFLLLGKTEKDKFESTEGKDIDNLLIEALQNVEKNVQNILGEYAEQQTNQKIKDIKVSHRYLVNRKM